MWIGPLSFLATAEKFELGKCIYKKGKLNFKIQKTNSIIPFAHALTERFLYGSSQEGPECEYVCILLKIRDVSRSQ